MYKHLETAGEYTSDEAIKMAEGFIGGSLAEELKDRVKKEIFLSEDAVDDGKNGTIYRVCINYPDGCKTLHSIHFNEGDCTDEKKREVAIKNGILEYHVFSDAGYMAVKKMELPKWVTDDVMGVHLNNERKAYYVSLLEKEYNRRVDEINFNDVKVSKSRMLDKFNSEDF